MIWANTINISKLDNGYTIHNSYTLSSDENYYKTEEEVLRAVALALSNNIEADKILEIEIKRVEAKDEEEDD